MRKECALGSLRLRTHAVDYMSARVRSVVSASRTRPSRRASRARPRTSLKVTEARAECGGEKRRVRPVTGDVGYTVARLQFR